MADNITLRIGQEAPLMELTGQKRGVVYLIVHETKRALLIAAVENIGGEAVDAKNYWFPKSVLTIDGAKPRCQTVNEAEDANIIVIPSWIWAKKEPAKPMGVSR
jgi:hypothetical protein